MNVEICHFGYPPCPHRTLDLFADTSSPWLSRAWRSDALARVEKEKTNTAEVIRSSVYSLTHADFSSVWNQGSIALHSRRWLNVSPYIINMIKGWILKVCQALQGFADQVLIEI